jgi:amino acid adenylation domain-containing protein
VHELVAEFGRLHPARIAIRGEGVTVDYGELDASSSRLSGWLTGAGVRKGDRVAVLAEPSVAMIVAVLAVLRCGAAYVPVDPAQPDSRVRAILRDARVSAAVVTQATRERLSGLGLPLVLADRADSGGVTDEAAVTQVALTDPAYLIYTSGTTGEPKGVVVEHGQLASSTAARRMVYPGTPVFLLLSPLAFDSSVAGIWGTLSAGGCVVVAGADEVRDPERLVELVDSHQVTHLLCVPSLYGFILDAAARQGRGQFPSLRTAIVAGEPLLADLVTRHFAEGPARCALVNEYGPTEATVWASYRRFDGPAPVSIGRPIPGARLYVLGEDRRPAPTGEPGELFVGGAGVARGYHNRPEATAAAFFDDPFAGTPGARMYRTGDLALWDQDGSLHFLGRSDHQVKIRGHRIELGAVEAELCALGGASEAVVVPSADGDSLTAFVLATQNVTSRRLREELASRVPAAMVPSRIVLLEAFPRSINGKTDRAALATREEAEAHPAATTAPEHPETTGTATADHLTAKVAAAWAEVLKVSHVPTDVNFFDLGGHSLAVFRLREVLERQTGKLPPVVALFRHTTVAAQAAFLRMEAEDTPADERRGRREAAVRERRLRARRSAAVGAVQTPAQATRPGEQPVRRPDAGLGA